MTEKKESLTDNNDVEVLKLISIKQRLLEAVILFGSGIFMTLSLPEVNWSLTAWVALAPLFIIIRNKTLFAAWRGGFWWSLGWGFTAFYWLREIDPAIPYLMAPTISVFVACWAMTVPVVWRFILLPADVRRGGYASVREYDWKRPWREFFVAIVISALWCIIVEWARSMIFPWNFLGSSQWRNLPLIQICEYTGVYGISFLIILFNVTLSMTVLCFQRKAISFKNPRRAPLLPTLGLIILVILVGYYSTVARMRMKIPTRTLRAGLVQGNISQRRNANFAMAKEALDVYVAMSRQLLVDKPDVVIWPECAVPVPLRSGSMLGEIFRENMASLMKESNTPFLIGSLDYTEKPLSETGQHGYLNSALMLVPDKGIVDQFDKIHRVPFGEYIPFRSILPGWIVNRIDMNRDLTPGTDFSPIELKPGFRAGISVCFEDVFPYISRREALLGANLLLVITNDAWYPTSSEPEQHLANSVFRAIETRMPFLRCGNNSASCLVSSTGMITKCLMRKSGPDGKKIPAPELRGRTHGVIEVEVPERTVATFYTRYGDVFILLCWIIAVVGFVMIAAAWLSDRKSLEDCFSRDKA